MQTNVYQFVKYIKNERLGFIGRSSTAPELCHLVIDVSPCYVRNNSHRHKGADHVSRWRICVDLKLRSACLEKCSRGIYAILTIFVTHEISRKVHMNTISVQQCSQIMHGHYVLCMGVRCKTHQRKRERESDKIHPFLISKLHRREGDREHQAVMIFYAFAPVLHGKSIHAGKCNLITSRVFPCCRRLHVRVPSLACTRSRWFILHFTL